MYAWLAADNIDPAHYAAIMRPWVMEAYGEDGGANPVHALERGECTPSEFEQVLAAQMVCRDGSPVAAQGLLTRMFAHGTLSVPMCEAMPALRAGGLLTGLLSNSWLLDDYPRDDFPAMFDAVVISGEVGMRKPEERIFRHAAGLLGVDPSECVFIDDLAANIAAAEAIGMTGVLHTDPATTLAELGTLLSLPLA